MLHYFTNTASTFFFLLTLLSWISLIHLVECIIATILNKLSLDQLRIKINVFALPLLIYYTMLFLSSTQIWISDLHHFPSLWRISFSISCKAVHRPQIPSRFLLFMGKSLSVLHFWRPTLQGTEFQVPLSLSLSVIFHSILVLLAWFPRTHM